jgi:hypothetical protein
MCVCVFASFFKTTPSPDSKLEDILHMTSGICHVHLLKHRRFVVHVRAHNASTSGQLLGSVYIIRKTEMYTGSVKHWQRGVEASDLVT